MPGSKKGRPPPPMTDSITYPDSGEGPPPPMPRSKQGRPPPPMAGPIIYPDNDDEPPPPMPPPLPMLSGPMGLSSSTMPANLHNPAFIRPQNIQAAPGRRSANRKSISSLDDEILRVLAELRLSQDTALAAYKASMDSALLTVRSEIANAISSHRADIDNLNADTGEQIKALHNDLKEIRAEITTGLQSLRHNSRTETVPEPAAGLRNEIGQDMADLRAGMRKDLDSRLGELRERLAPDMGINKPVRKRQARKSVADGNLDTVEAVVRSETRSARVLSDGRTIQESLTGRVNALADMRGSAVGGSGHNGVDSETRVRVLEEELQKAKEILRKNEEEVAKLSKRIKVLEDGIEARASTVREIKALEDRVEEERKVVTSTLVLYFGRIVELSTRMETIQELLYPPGSFEWASSAPEPPQERVKRPENTDRQDSPREGSLKVLLERRMQGVESA